MGRKRKRVARTRFAARGSGKEPIGRPSPLRSAQARSCASKLGFDPAEIRNAVHGIPETQEQVQTTLSLLSVGVVDGHLIEERVNRSAKRSKRRHSGSEVLGVDSR